MRRPLHFIRPLFDVELHSNPYQLQITVPNTEQFHWALDPPTLHLLRVPQNRLDLHKVECPRLQPLQQVQETTLNRGHSVPNFKTPENLVILGPTSHALNGYGRVNV